MTETTCPDRAAFRYTWPGRDESYVCAEHAGKLRAVSDAIGLHLQLIPLEPVAEKDHPLCRQKVSS